MVGKSGWSWGILMMGSGTPPNAGGSSNLIVKPGMRSGAEIEASLDRANLVTDWLGGNANGLNH